MKLINNRLYLDYNATAPLAESVTHWLAEGAFPFGNPSSIHSAGKQSKRSINQTIEVIKKTFNLPHYEIFFHSGATEGINDIVKGFAFHQLKNKENFNFVCFHSDHSAIVNQKEHIELLGGNYHALGVNENGEINVDEVITLLSSLDGKVLLNYTLVNNESGVHLSLEDAVAIKKKTGCFLHVDAVQLVGKIEDYTLSDQIDFYTFSGHKFGALKGVGFTLTKGLFDNWCSLIRGGGQQQAMRSGTENVLGIYSVKLALEESLMKTKQNVICEQRDFIEESLLKRYSNKIIIAGAAAKHRNVNTTYMILDGIKTDVLITAFDMDGIDISSGSACSSGTIKPSRVLMSMGYSEEQAKSSIRMSLGPDTQEGDGQIIFEKISKVLDRFLDK